MNLKEIKELEVFDIHCVMPDPEPTPPEDPEEDDDLVGSRPDDR